MKNKLVLSTIFISVLLISGCKKKTSSSSVISSSYSSEDKTEINSSSSSSSFYSSSEETNPLSYFDIKYDSELEFDVRAEVATSVYTNDNDGKVFLDCFLSDASVNHLTGNVYSPSFDGQGLAKESSILSSDFEQEMLVNQGVKDTYRVAAFSITFRHLTGNGGNDLGLYLDRDNTSFDLYSNDDVAKGYRIAFISDKLLRPNSDGVSKVFAPLQTAENCRYVANLDNIEGTAYNPLDLNAQYNEQSWPYAWASRDEYINRSDYLGFFKSMKSQTGMTAYATLSYYVIVWMEGTDPNVVNRADFNPYVAFYSTLSFKIAELPER